MILDCRSPDWNFDRDRRRVFVNGEEIRQVWYVDTDAGIVKSYDVLGDGEPHCVSDGFKGHSTILYAPEDFPGREVECPEFGVLSETLRGTVNLLPFD